MSRRAVRLGDDVSGDPSFLALRLSRAIVHTTTARRVLGALVLGLRP